MAHTIPSSPAGLTPRPQMEDGSAYTALPDSVGDDFAGWVTPEYDPESSRYTYCLNDPLKAQQRHQFCKNGGFRG